MGGCFLLLLGLFFVCFVVVIVRFFVVFVWVFVGVFCCFLLLLLFLFCFVFVLFVLLLLFFWVGGGGGGGGYTNGGYGTGVVGFLGEVLYNKNRKILVINISLKSVIFTFTLDYFSAAQRSRDYRPTSLFHFRRTGRAKLCRDRPAETAVRTP